MRPRRTYVDYLRDILDASEKAERFMADADLAQFVVFDKTIFDVIRALELIGEADMELLTSVRDRYPEVPLRSIAVIRDKLIHEYFGVNLEVVWKAVREDVPVLRPAVERMLADIGEKDSDL